MSRVTYAIDRNVAVLTIDNPPVNALSHAIRVDLVELLDRAQSDASVQAIVLIGAGRTFIAGADIREFGHPAKAPLFIDVQNSIEACTKPVVSALHGTALGGGLEIALTCHYRIGPRSVQLGLPEVNLGLLPGAGGTQRLPRLIGPEKALDMMLSGKSINGESGLRLGILDELAPTDSTIDLSETAVAFALSKLDQPLVMVRDRNDRVTNIDPSIFSAVLKENEKKWAGQIAQPSIVACVKAACEMPFEEGYKFAVEAFGILRESPQSKALRYAFFAEREASKIPGIPKTIEPKAISSAALIGAGTMGGGIAMSFANAGIPVKLLEMTQEALDRGIDRIRGNYSVSVNRGSMSQVQADTALALITTTISYDEISQADIVIEAVFEDMNAKHQVFRSLDKVMKPGAILASNTSALSIDEIAAATQRPENVVGTHFFSPANVMKLQENVRGEKSDAKTLVTVMNLAKQLGKVPVLSGNADGFIGNRILAVYGRECDFLLEEGATPWQIDRALQGFGFPMGLYLMRDMAGLDVGWRMRKNREATRDRSLRYSPIADRICERGRFGQKTGAGYYKYDGRKASPDQDIEELIINVAKEAGIQRRMISDEEIVTRVLTAMANEGAKIVGDGIALRTSDVDVTYLFGYGFPRFQGGPMYWAEQQGLAKILDTVLSYQKEQGVLWEPAPLLIKRAVTGRWSDAE